MSKAPQFETVNFEQMSFSNPKQSQGGKGIHIVYARTSARDNSKVQFQINKPDPALFDMNTPLEKRQKLLEELCAVRTNWHLKEEAADSQFSSDGRKTVLLTLPSSAYIESAKRLDLKNVNTVIENSKWFKGKPSDETLRGNFVHLCQRYPFTDEVSDEEKLDTLRIKVKEGEGEFDTKIRVQNPHTGKFFKGTMNDIEMFSRVVPVLENTGLYFRGNESGGMLFATALVVFPKCETRALDALDIGMDLPMETDAIIPGETDPALSPPQAQAQDPSDQTVINYNNNDVPVPPGEPLF